MLDLSICFLIMLFILLSPMFPLNWKLNINSDASIFGDILHR